MPSSPLLLKDDRNKIFKAIERAGLHPIEFDYNDDGAEVRIKHKWSESYFTVGGNAVLYTGHYVSGDAPAWPYEVYNWEALMMRVSTWLEEVKHDLETPDLWAELRRETELLGDTSNEATENTRFTAEEQKEIVRRLRELEEQARNRYSLSAEQMKVLDAKINYLIQAVGRLGRTDWRGLFISVLLSFILASAFPPESVREVVLPVLRAIGHLYGPPELPGI
jgi:hypothetical protein